MMIEPPGDFRRCRVFEIDNGVFVAREFAFIEERACTVDQPVVSVTRTGGYTFAMKPREQRGRASSIKTLVVVKDPNLQDLPLHT